jgi:hypothetical protein
MGGDDWRAKAGEETGQVDFVQGCAAWVFGPSFAVYCGRDLHNSPASTGIFVDLQNSGAPPLLAWLSILF